MFGMASQGGGNGTGSRESYILDRLVSATVVGVEELLRLWKYRSGSSLSRALCAKKLMSASAFLPQHQNTTRSIARLKPKIKLDLTFDIFYSPLLKIITCKREPDL
jgi:hypothetical protein